MDRVAGRLNPQLNSVFVAAARWGHAHVYNSEAQVLFLAVAPPSSNFSSPAQYLHNTHRQHASFCPKLYLLCVHIVSRFQ